MITSAGGRWLCSKMVGSQNPTDTSACGRFRSSSPASVRRMAATKTWLLVPSKYWRQPPLGSCSRPISMRALSKNWQSIPAPLTFFIQRPAGQTISLGFGIRRTSTNKDSTGGWLCSRPLWTAFFLGQRLPSPCLRSMPTADRQNCVANRQLFWPA